MKKLLAFLLFSIASLAQQPQSTAPLSAVNAKYLQGAGTGYWSTAGAGLTLNITAGTAFCSGAIATYAGGTLSMTNNTTNYVYLNTGSSCVPAVKTTTFTSSDVPIAVVVTSAGAITTITDDRTMFAWNSSGGTVTSFSAGALSPLFTTSVANPTTTPALSFSLSTAAKYTVFGNNTNGTATPSFFSFPISAALLSTDSNGQVVAASAATSPIVVSATGGISCPTCNTSGAAVNSVSGDGALISNSGSTGAVTLTLGNALKYQLWGRNANSTGTPAYFTPPTSAVTLATDSNGQLISGPTPVTAVTASSPIVSSGGTTPAISCPTCLTTTGSSSTIGGPMGGWIGASLSSTWGPWFSGNGNAAYKNPAPTSFLAGHLSGVGFNNGALTGVAYMYFQTFVPSVFLSDPVEPRMVWPLFTGANQTFVVSEVPTAALFSVAQGIGFGGTQGNAWGSANPTIYGFSWATYGVAGQPVGAYLNGNTVGSSTTTYAGWGVGSGGFGTEATHCSILPFSATIQNLWVYNQATQPASGAMTVTARYTHNGVAADTPVTVTIPLSQGNSALSDVTHTQAMSAGDCFDFKFANAATGASAPIQGVSALLSSLGATCGAAGNSQCTGAFIFPINGAVASGSNAFFPAHTSVSAQTTEAKAETPTPGNMTIGPLYCYVAVNPGTSTANVTVEHNGADTSLTLGIPTSGCTNNVCSDTTTGHYFSASYGTTPDTISLKVNQASGTNVSIGSCSVGINQTN